VKGRCTLARAIVAANNDASRLCTPGRGPDSISLPVRSSLVLTQINNTTLARPMGLPVIRSAMGINGNESSIRRVINAPRFGIFGVSKAGRLTLNNVRVSGAIGGWLSQSIKYVQEYLDADPNCAILHTQRV